MFRRYVRLGLALGLGVCIRPEDLIRHMGLHVGVAWCVAHFVGQGATHRPGAAWGLALAVVLVLIRIHILPWVPSQP